MELKEAMKAVKEGKKVRDVLWGDTHSSICIKDGRLWWDKNDVEIPNRNILELFEVIEWKVVEEEKQSRKQCNDTDHLKIELIKQIVKYEHTGCFEAWFFDFKQIINHTIDKYKP